MRSAAILTFPRCRMLLGAAVVAAFVGCGGHGTYPVLGKVVFEGSSAPASELAGYTVTFVTVEPGADGKKKSAVGVVNGDGTFKLGTFGLDDGALPGAHNVAITAPTPLADEQLPPSRIDARFEDPATSGLVVTVNPGPNEVTLTVEKPASAPAAEKR